MYFAILESQNIFENFWKFVFVAYICLMNESKPKVLAVSFPEPHFELHDIIVEMAAKNRVTVSHYVRSLMYACMDRVEIKGSQSLPVEQLEDGTK